MVLGISPAHDATEHVETYGKPLDGSTHIFYTGLGLTGRNVLNIRNCDLAVFVGGEAGTLQEFAIAVNEGRVVGVLTNSGGICETLPAEKATEDERRSVRGKIGRSPVLVVVTQTGNADDPVRDLEDYAACACATQNLLLAAHAEGLAAKWSTGKLAHSPGARRYLGLAEHDRIVAYVYLGYAAGTVSSEPRRNPPVTTWHGVPSN